MKTVKIFLASSEELVDDRRTFEIFLNRRNKTLVKEGVFLELVIWEDFLDAMSKTRLQDEYNKALVDCDIFIMLFYTKVGKYTEEEFDTAYDHFMKNDSPMIFTYFKNTGGDVKPQESLEAFKKRLSELGHFYTVYNNVDRLQLHFMDQLQKLEQKGLFNTETPPRNNDKGGSGLDIINVIKTKVASGASVNKILDEYKNELLAMTDEFEMELTLLQGRSSKLERDERIGIISNSDAGVERARITHTLLSLLDDIKRSYGS